ncbi:hypothetical protein JZU61_04160 [bacterium]|nr:hypothetical protein [bacterium]
MKPDIETIKGYCHVISRPSDFHGVKHWQRVESNGIALAALTGANMVVVRLFAYLHDCRRVNDFHDPNHGKRAAQLIEDLRGGMLSGLTETELYQLKFACENHTDLHRCDDETVNTCFDADRLDLTRIGLVLDPLRFATLNGSRMATELNALIPAE